MTFIPRQESFVCEHCHKEVTPLEHGSYRNHCPFCLYAKHVDQDGPGDRLSTCQGLMKPISAELSSKKGWIITHECEKCGKVIPNKSAPDDDVAGNADALRPNAD